MQYRMLQKLLPVFQNIVSPAGVAQHPVSVVTLAENVGGSSTASKIPAALRPLATDITIKNTEQFCPVRESQAGGTLQVAPGKSLPAAGRWLNQILPRNFTFFGICLHINCPI